MSDGPEPGARGEGWRHATMAALVLAILFAVATGGRGHAIENCEECCSTRGVTSIGFYVGDGTLAVPVAHGVEQETALRRKLWGPEHEHTWRTTSRSYSTLSMWRVSCPSPYRTELLWEFERSADFRTAVLQAIADGRLTVEGARCELAIDDDSEDSVPRSPDARRVLESLVPERER
ncbi:MAG: hypothetical protein K8T90_11350 [Planctomycetes bacterium]|nr:hypothetical protein [Planctomycetota bacterium]